MDDDDLEDYDDEECICIVFWRTKTKRLYHWHWPRAGILTCTRAANAAREHMSP